MKKLLLAVSVAAFATSVSANEILGPSSIVNFNGRLDSPTCEIAQSSRNQQISLAPAYATDPTSVVRDFTIQLTNCSPLVDKQVTLRFTPEDDALEEVNSEKVLKNTALDGQKAKNVAIRVVHVNGQTETNVFNGDKTLYPSQELNTGDITFNFKAKYVKTKDTGEAGAGLVSGSLPFTVVYK